MVTAALLIGCADDVTPEVLDSGRADVNFWETGVAPRDACPVEAPYAGQTSTRALTIELRESGTTAHGRHAGLASGWCLSSCDDGCEPRGMATKKAAKKTATKKVAKKTATKKAAKKTATKRVAKKTATKGTVSVEAAPSSTAASSHFAPDAFGLRFLREGFGSTPEDDLLFALGYPHVVVPTDDPMPQVDADTLYKKFPIDTTHVPRVFLHRLYEAVSCGADDDGIREALKSTAQTWTGESIRKALRVLFEHGSAYELLLLEAMVGSAAVAEGATDVLEALPPKEWDGAGGLLDTYAYEMIGALYFVLLRTPSALHDKLVERLEKIFAQAKKFLGGRPADTLDVILHGRAGVERSGYRSDDGALFQDLMYAHDDPAWVEKTALKRLAKLRPSDRAAFDARLAFIGGPRVVEALRAGTTKFHSSQRATIKAQLARIR